MSIESVSHRGKGGGVFQRETHIFLPFAIFASVAFLFEYFQWDLNIASWFFALQHGVDSWPMRLNWYAENMLHTGGRNLVVLASVILLGSIISCWRVQRWRHYLRSLVCLFISVLFSVVTVRFGKDLTHVSCPWDIQMFGGTHEYWPIFSRLPEGAEFGQCFPGGHSSGGYAWVALYYVALVQKPAWRFKGLAIGLVAGIVFSLTQQVRGAHFFSHGLWSLGIAWFYATFWYCIFFRASTSAKVEKADRHGAESDAESASAIIS